LRERHFPLFNGLIPYSHRIGIRLQVGTGDHNIPLREDEAAQEIFLLDGDFHSGSISSVKVVGYLGPKLLIHLFAIFATMGYQLINSEHGTPHQFCSLFYGISVVILPFFYIFIFGDYKAVMTTILIDV
jgi:hypothetical protein